MAHLGQRNRLPVVREGPPGYFLDDGEGGEILLPGKYLPEGARPGEGIEVFVYRDSEDRPVATTETPHAMVGDFAALKIVDISPGIGAFLDWGLEKDLLLPRREQGGFRSVGETVVVRVLLDEKSHRIVASTRLGKWFDRQPPAYARDHPVKLLIASRTPLGYKAVVDNLYEGMLYDSELSGPLEIGLRTEGFVKNVRPDGKLDLSLDRSGFARVAPITNQILDALRSADGQLPYNDNSPPETIRSAFGVSKKAFKQALGSLYRKRLITWTADGIALVKKNPGHKCPGSGVWPFLG
ncbi:MAG: GntR family transcriptional regulator [Chthoniobacterales bacterium]|nr:GntR family transcriptional regulator [Chthoniobacterales bacterium]